MAAITKIVLDADVIIHFIKAERFSTLLHIFPEYECVILDVVYNEVALHPSSKTLIDNALNFFSGRISLITFNPVGESRLEYAKLISSLGRGESACMVYCRDNADVLGSSNLRDIKDYCLKNRITYLTTLDFLYYAFVRGKITEADCNAFMEVVNKKGSRLPIIDIISYRPSCRL